ncbi:hypothetical protein U1Q18_007588, partial [Sarracenia purpurea var. burkii]
MISDPPSPPSSPSLRALVWIWFEALVTMNEALVWIWFEALVAIIEALVWIWFEALDLCDLELFLRRSLFEAL